LNSFPWLIDKLAIEHSDLGLYKSKLNHVHAYVYYYFCEFMLTTHGTIDFQNIDAVNFCAFLLNCLIRFKNADIF